MKSIKNINKSIDEKNFNAEKWAITPFPGVRTQT
jgi:hypothetical protein